MDSREGVHTEPFFLTSSMNPSSIMQNAMTVCNCESKLTEGVCEHEIFNEDDEEEANNNVYPPDELDFLVEEFDSNKKDYKCRSSIVDSPDDNNGQLVDSVTLSAVYQGEWPLEKMFWNGSSEGVSIERDLHPDTCSIMSFDSSMTTSSMLNHSSSKSEQSSAKADVVYTLLSMLHTHDKMEVSEMLLTMSGKRENCIAMIESGCLPLLVQLLHDRNEKQTFMAYRQSSELRKRASQILHNIIFSQPDDVKGRREARVLKLLEQVREHCEILKNSMYEVNDNEKERCSDQQLGPTVAALMKLSFDEDHRHAMCLLGGLQAIAELIEIDREAHGCTNDKYCISIRRYSGMALTNLTFGDGNNKSLLCSMKPFMQALVAQLQSPSEELRQVSASVLRNLSWRADSESKIILRDVGAVTTLMKAAMEANKESTLKSILSALWNLSAHCSENKADICSIDGALGFLVGTLTYKSGSKNLSVVENGGGILRNVSSHIAIQNDHRITLRKHNCLQILLHHLKSPSLTVVSNACGTLWNLSARNPQDQRTLWEMGAVGMLKKLINSKHKMISMGSSAALKNLLSAMPPGINSGLGLSVNDYNSGMPSLHVRKQKILNAEIDQNLSETYDNTDSPKSSPTFRKKVATSAINRRSLSAPVHRQGIPQRVGSKLPSDLTNSDKNSEVSTNIQRYSSPSRSPHRLPIDAPKSDVDNSKNLRESVREPTLRVGSPSNMRPYSYPAQKGKSNVKSQPCSVNNAYQVTHHQSRKAVPNSNANYSKFTQRMKNMKYDELESNDQPVDYSIKYSEDAPNYGPTSKLTSESKIPLPKLHHVEDACRPSAIVAPMCIKEVGQRNSGIPVVNSQKNKHTNSSFGSYMETDLDDFDQVVDYSKRYQDRENLDEYRLREKRNKKPSFPVANTQSLKSATEDTMKVYCTEDTPVNFSSASSLTDLCNIDNPSHPQQSKQNVHHNDNEVCELVASNNSSILSDNNKEGPGKDGKTTEEANCIETPLMFSRCSSFGSLSSFDQPSVQDDRSSVSDFSRMTSGIISPSELPDSPSQTMPPSPVRKRQNAFSYDRKDSAMNGPPCSNGLFDEVRNVYAIEGTPMAFSTTSSLSSLSIDNEQEHVRASLVKNLPPMQTSHIHSHPETKVASGPVQSYNKMNGEEKSWNRTTSTPIPESAVPKNVKPFETLWNVGNTESPRQKCFGFSEDTVKVYNVEGTPNLSHSASFSDLSMLSFCAEKNTCDQSFIGSENGSDDVNHLQMEPRKMNNLDCYNGSVIVPSLNTSQDHSDSSSVYEDNETLNPIPEAAESRYKIHLKIETVVKANVATAHSNVHLEDSESYNQRSDSHRLSDGEKLLFTSKHDVQVEKIGNSMLVEGTPVSFSRNSSLSSLSIESGDDIYPENTYVNNENLAKHSVRNSLPDIPLTKQNNASLQRLPKKPEELVSEEALVQKCILPKPKNFGTQSRNYCPETEIKRSPLVVAKKDSTNLDQSKVSAGEQVKSLSNMHYSPSHKFEDSALNVAMKQKLVQECITAGMPESNISAKSTLTVTAINKGLSNNSTSHLLKTNQDSGNLLTAKKSGSSEIEKFPIDTNSTRETKGSSEDELLQQCIVAGMPKPKNPVNSSKVTSQNMYFQKSIANTVDLNNKTGSQNPCIPTNAESRKAAINHSQSHKEGYDEKQLTDVEEALLQECILAGMPKPKTTTSNFSETDKQEHLVQRSLDSNKILPGQNTHHAPNQCCKPNILNEAVKPNTGLLKMGKPRSASNPVSLEGCDEKLSDFEEAMLQECILAGMPKPKAYASKTKSQENNFVNHPTASVQKAHLVPNQRCKPQQSNDVVSLSSKSNTSNEAPLEGYGEEKLTDLEEAMLQECILAGMPKPRNTSQSRINSQTQIFHESVINPEQSNTKSSDNIPYNDLSYRPKLSSDMCNPVPEESRSKPSKQQLVKTNEGCDTVKSSDLEEALLRECISSGMPKRNQTDNKLKSTQSIKAVKKDDEHLDNVSSGKERLGPVGMESPKNQTCQLVTNDSCNSTYVKNEGGVSDIEKMMPKSKDKSDNLSENEVSSQQLSTDSKSLEDTVVVNPPVDLSFEAQKLTDDMLDAVVDGTEDMTVSTLSCMSDIENITPPSIMGELACLSMTNSCSGDDMKLGKSFKLDKQKKSLLKELQLSHLGSDSDLSKLKCKLSDSTLSLNSNSTDILENINPPSALNDLSLTASMTSLDNLNSDAIDNKPVERIGEYVVDDISMNERLCEAAAIVEMYTKEFSNITGKKNPDGNAFNANALTEAFDDNTEPACDTIASDIEFVDELPCDEDDLGSETLLAPQLSSLHKDDAEEGSMENLTLTLTQDTPPVADEPENDKEIPDEILRQNADLILKSLKKIHISESSDFGGLASNDMLEDETLSLVSNGSDDDSLSPDGVFSDNAKNGSSSPEDKQKQCSLAKVPQPGKCSSRKFGFVNNSNMESSRQLMSSTVNHLPDSSATDHLKNKQLGINTGTFTRKKPSVVENVPTISNHVLPSTMKTQAYSSRESIESCSTSNSVSSLSSCSDASSNKLLERRKNVTSKIRSIWKNNDSNKVRSKYSYDSSQKFQKSLGDHVTMSDGEFSPSQRSHSQSSSPKTLSRSSTDERINIPKDSLQRPTTLKLSRRNESPKHGSSSPSATNHVTSPMSQGRSNLPIRKSMIPTCSKVEPKGKPGKPKPYMSTMV